MSPTKVLIPSVILAGGLLISVPSIKATPEYGKKEKKSCTFCHLKVVKDKVEMSKNLKTVGTCYKENNHSLANCSQPK